MNKGHFVAELSERSEPVCLHNAQASVFLVQRSVHPAGWQGSSHCGLLWSGDRAGKSPAGPDYQVI